MVNMANMLRFSGSDEIPNYLTLESEIHIDTENRFSHFCIAIRIFDNKGNTIVYTNIVVTKSRIVVDHKNVRIYCMAKEILDLLPNA